MQHEEMVAQVRKLDLVKGDCVVITSPQALGQERRLNLARDMKRVLDEMSVTAHVIVLDEGMQVSILRTSELECVDAA